MRRLKILAMALAFLLILSACGGVAPVGPNSTPDAYPPFNNSNSVLQESGGLQTALPLEYLELLYVETEFPDASESWKPLISVYEKASYEFAMEEYGGGGGFLFGFLSMDQASFEQFLSADGSGMDVFATDGERYYAYTYPTDVQFCRPDGEFSTESEDWKTWEKLCEIGPLVQEDFLTRNGLQSFTVRDYAGQLAADYGDHVCMKYYTYFLRDGDTRIYDTLLLQQPARQGEGGIWAVDQWMDVYGNPYFYFPDSGLPAAEYYAQLQEECDAGQHPELLTPAGAAAAFVMDYFGHETAEGSFEETPGVNLAYMELNQRLEQIVLDIMLGEAVDSLELLDCLGQATADNWGVLGRNLYGSDWFVPLMNAVAAAAVGAEQQQRDEAILSLLLATADAQTDFETPLNDVLKHQKQADPEAFDSALAAFPEGAFDIAPDTGWISSHFGGWCSLPVNIDVPTY